MTVDSPQLKVWIHGSGFSNTFRGNSDSYSFMILHVKFSDSVLHVARMRLMEIVGSSRFFTLSFDKKGIF
jgi:hypothetical protein